MAAGQVYNKMAFIIQARMESTRLPGKVMLPVPLESGIPLIRRIVDQLKNNHLGADIIVATSQNTADDRLCKYCTDHEIQVFRGDEDDVLSRYITLINEYNYDVVIRCTGDNAILDIPAIEKTVHTHIRNQNDYTCTKGLPIGMNVEVISGEVLTGLTGLNDITDADKEHVTLYLRNSAKFKKQEVIFSESTDLSNFRVTLDYPSDYAVISILLSLQEVLQITGLRLINHAMTHYPWLFSINQDNYQKVSYHNQKEEITAAIKLLKSNGLSRAAELLGRKHD